MSSLVYCIDISGISKTEGDKLKAVAKAIRLDEGFSAKESNRMAVEQAISAINGERADIVKQIKSQLPEHFKAPEEKAEVTPEYKIEKYEGTQVGYGKPGRRGALARTRKVKGYKVIEPDGYERTFDTKKEAEAWVKEQKVEVAPEKITPPEGKIVQVPTESLFVDATKFQFKRFLGKGGVSSTLKSIKKYDPDLGGLISVWRSPSDGKTYVVNGHHRYELAKRTGQKELTVNYLEAANAGEAKTKGALINIAEGQGTPEDAAIVFRRNNVTPEEIEAKYGISLKGNIAQEGMALSGLSPEIFEKVEIGEFSRNWGVVIGEKLRNDFDAQNELAKLIKREGKKKHINTGIIEQVINDIQGVGKRTETQETLFGDEIKTRPLLIERAELRDYAINKLLSDKRLFGIVSKEEKAARLRKAGNIITPEENKKLSEEAGKLATVLNQLASHKGPINDTINEYAKELANAVDKTQRDATKQSFFESIQDAIRQEIPGVSPKVSERDIRYGKGREVDTGIPAEQVEGFKPKPKLLGGEELIPKVKPVKKTELAALDKIERKATSKFEQDRLFEPNQQALFDGVSEEQKPEYIASDEKHIKRYVPITRKEADSLFDKGAAVLVARFNVRGPETTGEEGYYMRLPFQKGVVSYDKKEIKSLYEKYKKRHGGTESGVSITSGKTKQREGRLPAEVRDEKAFATKEDETQDILTEDERMEAVEETEDMYDDMLSETMAEFRAAKEGESQKWTAVPLANIEKIWNNFITTGVVRNKKGLQAIADKMLKNAIQLRVNTELMAHTPLDPNTLLEEHGIDLFTEVEDSVFTEWMIDPRTGQWRISDRINDIMNAASNIYTAKTAEKKLVAIDRLLNIIHQRTDLASLFVEGGRESLESLANKSKQFATKTTKPQKTITRKDLRKIFSRMKHIRTGQDKNGNLWFKATGRPKITIFELDNITGHLNTSAGQIPVGSYLRDTIELKTGGKGHTADISTIFHEFFHWLSKNQILSANDTISLNRVIAKAENIAESDVTEEHRAYYVGDHISEWEIQKHPRIRRILRKLKDFMNAIYDFAAKAGWVAERERTATNVLSDIESGKVLGKKGKAAEVMGTLAPAFQMAGVSAIGAPTGQIVKAQELLAEGKSEKEVWRETGWMKGVEKEDTWKFEIDDSEAELKIKISPHPPLGIDTKHDILNEVLSHPELFKAYPELRNLLTSITIGKDVKSKGKLTESRDRSTEGLKDLEPEITVYAKDIVEAKAILLHEVQHAIQAIEDFARGGSPDQSVTDIVNKETRWLEKNNETYSELEKAVDKHIWEGTDPDGWKIKSLQDQQNTILDKHIRDKYGVNDTSEAVMIEYRRLAGEIEARDTAARAKLTPAQRGINFNQAKKEWQKAQKIEESSQYKVEENKWNQSDFSDKALKERNKSPSHKKVYALHDKISGMGYDLYNRTTIEALSGDKSAQDSLMQMPYESQGIPEDQWIITEGKGTSFSISKSAPEIKVIGEDKSILNRINPEVSNFLKTMSAMDVYIVPRTMGKYGYVGRGMQDRPQDIHIGPKALKDNAELNATIFHEALHQIESGRWKTSEAMAMKAEWDAFKWKDKTPKELKEIGFKDSLWTFKKSQVKAIKAGEFFAEMGEDYLENPETLEKQAKPIFDFFEKHMVKETKQFATKPAKDYSAMFRKYQEAATKKTKPKIDRLKNVSLDQKTKQGIADTQEMTDNPSSPEGFNMPSEGRGRQVLDTIQWKIQDKLIHLKKVQTAIEKQESIKLPDDANVYQTEELYHYKTTKRINNADRDLFDPLIESIHKSKHDLEDVELFLRARHAPEANKRLQEINPKRDDNTALSGMSSAPGEEASIIMTKYSRDPAMLHIAEQIDAITKATRQMMIEDGLATKAEIQAWENAYKYYIPLRREKHDLAMPKKGRGMYVGGKESKKRLVGSAELKPINIVANIMAQHESTIIRAEKAKVGRAMLKLAKEHPNKEFWTVDAPELKPFLKQRADDAKQLDLLTGLPGALSEVVYGRDILYKFNDNVLVTKIDGIEHTITFNEQNLHSQRIVKSLKNLGADNSNAAINILSKITRILAIVNTSANPEFIISNFARDIQTAGYNINDTEAKGVKIKIFKDVFKALQGIRHGVRGKYDTEWAKHYEDFEKAGAQTGWIDYYKNIEAREKTLKKKLALLKPGTWPATQRTIRDLFNLVSNENTAVENAIRLSTYKHLKDIGLSNAKAASAAKNLTVNFNRRGDAGQALNALYLFFNANAQGSVRLIYAASRSPVVRKMMLGTVGFAVMLDILNRAIGGDDDDGEKKYDKVPDWVKEHNLVIMRSNGDYFKIPLPWGYNTLHVLGQIIGEAVDPSYQKDFSAIASSGRLGSAVLASFNPLGSESSLLQIISPTVIDPFIQWAENQNFAGIPLRPEQNPFDVPKPEYQMYFRNARGPSKWIAKRLNFLTGGDITKPGLIDVSPEVFDLFIDTFTGGAGKFLDNTLRLPKTLTEEDVDIRHIPFARRMYGEPSEFAARTTFYDNLNEIRYAEKSIKHYQTIRDAGALRKARKANAVELRFVERAKDTKKAVGRLRDRQKQIEKSKIKEDVKTKRIESLEKQIKRKINRFNKQYFDAKQ